MVTSREIARLAGVSQATVSRVLQGTVKVSDDTQARVKRVMADVGYVPNAQARAMRTNRSGVIGVVTGRITNPFYPAFLNPLAQHIADADRRMALWISEESASEDAAVEAIRARLIDGLIFTTVTAGSSALQTALELGLPVVLANRSLDDLRCDQVTSNNVEGGRLVARYLLSHGRTNIAVVGGNASVSTGRERLRGFLDELERNGVHIPGERRLESDFLHDDARAAGERMFSSQSPPDAVFCVNDLVAFGVIDAAIRLGVEVPKDVWIIGYDDIPMAAWDVFGLTTVRQPIGRLARTAVEMLLARIEAPHAPFEHRRFSGELVIRRSTNHASLSDPPVQTL